MISNAMMPPPPQYGGATQSGSKMSSEQSEALQKILSDYDVDNISDEDAKNITDSIKELGISPGKELGAVLTEAGIDPQGLAEQAGLGKPQKGGGGGQQPPPPGAGGPPKGEVNSEAISALQLILEDYEGDDLTDDDWTDIISNLEEQGIDTSKPLLNIQA